MRRGRERRIHKVFMTRNTEYHVRRDRCVGVRDRRSGQWLPSHLAVRSRISGGIRFNNGGSLLPNAGLPRVGECLFLHAAGRDLVTSAVLTIERPMRDIVQLYPPSA